MGLSQAEQAGVLEAFTRNEKKVNGPIKCPLWCFGLAYCFVNRISIYDSERDVQLNTMDDSLDSFTVWITSASLILVTIIPLNAFWSIHLRSTPIAQPSQPVRFARVYMSLALPIWIM